MWLCLVFPSSLQIYQVYMLTTNLSLLYVVIFCYSVKPADLSSLKVATNLKLLYVVMSCFSVKPAGSIKSTGSYKSIAFICGYVLYFQSSLPIYQVYRQPQIYSFYMWLCLVFSVKPADLSSLQVTTNLSLLYVVMSCFSVKPADLSSLQVATNLQLLICGYVLFFRQACRSIKSTSQPQIYSFYMWLCLGFSVKPADLSSVQVATNQQLLYVVMSCFSSQACRSIKSTGNYKSIALICGYVQFFRQASRSIKSTCSHKSIAFICGYVLYFQSSLQIYQVYRQPQIYNFYMWLCLVFSVKPADLSSLQVATNLQLLYVVLSCFSSQACRFIKSTGNYKSIAFICGYVLFFRQACRFIKSTGNYKSIAFICGLCLVFPSSLQIYQVHR